MKLFTFLLPLLMVASFSSCQNNGDSITQEAELIWTGPLAADGCGFFLEMNGQEYKPANEDAIPPVFQEAETTPVTVTYEKLEEPQEYSCGMIPTRHEVTIRIVDIKKR